MKRSRSTRRLVGSGLGSALLVLLCALSGCAPARVEASVVQALSLEQLTRKADEIVVAVATEQSSRRHIDGKAIVTDFSLRVEDVLKGRSKRGGIVIATVLGGALDGVGLQVPGEAGFALGQRVLAFLYRAPHSGDLRVVGMAQGVLALKEQDGTLMVIPGGGGAALVERGSDGELRDAPAAIAKPQPLTDIVSRIRAIVAAQR